MDLSDLRENFEPHPLMKEDLKADPLDQLQDWMQEAMQFGIEQPNAMSLATASAAGIPSARFVLLKEIRSEGLVFYSDARSRKIRDLSENPKAAVAIHWDSMHRQIRASGEVVMLPYRDAAAYFRRRPRDSQLAFHAAAQGEVLQNRKALDSGLQQIAKHFPKEVVAPHTWVGCLIVVQRVEFWQERESRLHDRIEYVRDSGGWVKQRLAP